MAEPAPPQITPNQHGSGIKSLIVATATDSDFVELTAVWLASIRRNAGPAVKSVHVFCHRVSNGDKDLLRQSFASDSLAIHELHKTEITAFANVGTHGFVSATSYARLLIPELLAQEKGRVLYLDCDTIVNGDLSPLANLDMQGKPLAAYAVPATRLGEWFASFGVSRDTPYCNAGVLLIDLARWKSDNIGGAVRALARNHPQFMRAMDQALLNAAIQGNFVKLDRTWNMYESTTKGYVTTPAADFEAARIIHYLGRYKPNFTNCNHPAQNIFLDLRADTPFGDRPLVGPVARGLRANRMRLRRWAGRVPKLARRFTRRTSASP